MPVVDPKKMVQNKGQKIPDILYSSAKEKHHKAAICEIQHDEMSYQRIPRDIVEEFMREVAHRLIGGLQMFPSRLASRLAKETSEERIFQILSEEKLLISRHLSTLIEGDSIAEALIDKTKEAYPRTQVRGKPSKKSPQKAPTT